MDYWKKWKEGYIIAAIDSDILLQLRLNCWVIAAARIVTNSSVLYENSIFTVIYYAKSKLQYIT